MAADRKSPRGAKTGRKKEREDAGSRPIDRDESPSGHESRISARVVALRAAAQVLDAVLAQTHQMRWGLRRRPGSRASSDGVVLVVDDQDDRRRMYVQALREDGWDAIEARDGREALDAALESLPDVVVLDDRTPQIDRAAAVRRLAHDPRTMHVPIVLISADADNLPRDVRLACAAFLPKPCAPEDLVRVARLVLEARAPVR